MTNPQDKANLPSSLGSVRIGSGIKDYVELLIKGKKTILLTLTVVLIVMIGYLILAPRTYKAATQFRIDKSKALLMANGWGDSNKSPSEAQNLYAQREVEILRTRSVLGKIVEDLNLMIDVSPVYFPIIGETLVRLRDKHDGRSNAWWGFGRWAWGSETIKIERFDVPDHYLEKEFLLIALADSRFRLLGPKDKVLAEGAVGELISADIDDGESIMIKLGQLEAHPGMQFELSRRTSLSAIDSLQKAFTVTQVSKDADVISIELKGKDPERLAQLVNDIARLYVNATVDWEAAAASQKLSFLESQLPLTKEHMEQAEQALSVYKQKHRAVALSAEAKILLMQVAEMDALLIKLKQKREEQRQRLENSQPERIATDAQIRRGSRRLAALEKRLQDLPKAQQDMLSLSRDAQVNTALYTSLLNSAEEQRIAVVGNSRIVDVADVPENPYWPQPGLLLAIAALVGLSLGAALVVLRHSHRLHDNYAALLEYQVGLPLFGAIPYSKNQKCLGRRMDQGKDWKSAALRSHDTLHMSVESLRALRTSLESSLDSDESKVIMVSSPVPGMGKSFISINLAALLASIRKRVLIIDADMHNGCLHETFSVARQSGLSDLLLGKADLGDVVVNLPDIGIDLIPRGELVPNPAELLGKMAGTLEQLKSFYNHIVIDSPPVLGANDASIIGKHCDATFLVVKEGRYIAQELEVSFRRLQEVGVSPNGFIINDMKEGTSYYPYFGCAYQRHDGHRERFIGLSPC